MKLAKAFAKLLAVEPPYGPSDLTKNNDSVAGV